VLVPVQVPGLGYTTCTVSESVPSEMELPLPNDWRVERPDAFVLENERLRAEFDTVSCILRSLVDKSSGEELLGRPGAGFRRVEEDDAKGMTAWTVGRWMSVRSLHENVRVVPQKREEKRPVRQSLAFEVAFDSSKLKAVVSLDKDSPVLRWSVECEWLEVGRKDVSIPQLSFHLPLAFECKTYRYDVPFGTIDRAPAAQDLPANSWAAVASKKGGRRTVMLVAGQKHGFRCADDSLSLTLIRSSFDPDPFPELGMHRFDFGVCVLEGGVPSTLVREAAAYNHGFNVISVAPHAGTLPRAHGFVELEAGPVVLAAVKMPEDGGRRLVARLYEADGKEAIAVLRFFRAPAAAWLADLNERRLEAGPEVRVDGTSVSVAVAPHTVATLVVEFPGGKA
jgi:alpha-mannosidase